LSGEANPQSGTIARLASQRTKYRDAARKAIADRKDLAKQLDDVRKELDDLRTSGGSARVTELETELRTLRHRAAFDRLAKERGADEADLDDLFALSGYKPEGDEPDPKAIGKILDAAREHPTRRKFFRADDAAGDDAPEASGRAARETITPAPKPPAPDAGRGGRATPAGSVTLTPDQLSDPKFMLDPRNAELKRNAKIKL
jgi:hypothetical protein